MNWENFEVPWAGGQLAGKFAGSGKNLVLCLHGYGNDRHLFDRFLEDFPDGYTLVSVDLPYFGDSFPENNRPIEIADLKEFWEVLGNRFDHDARYLICFSLGAKVGMALTQEIPGRMIRSLLIAPDGLKIHPMYRFCIYNPVGRKLFRWALRSPGFFLFILRSLYKLKIADAFKYRFVKGQFERKERRELLERVWFGYSNIRVDRQRLREVTEENKIEWHLLWGAHDNILPAKIGRKFAAEMPGATLHTIEAGHLVLKKHPKKVREWIHKLFENELNG